VHGTAKALIYLVWLRILARTTPTCETCFHEHDLHHYSAVDHHEHDLFVTRPLRPRYPMRHFLLGGCRRQLTQTLQHPGLSTLSDMRKESVETWCEPAQLSGSKMSHPAGLSGAVQSEINEKELVSNVDQMHDQNGQVKALAVPYVLEQVLNDVVVQTADINEKDLVSNVAQMHDQNGQVKALVVP
jgi:hypothetical protein